MRPVLFVLTLVSAAVAQDSSVAVRHHRDWSSAATSGWCAVKVWVEDEAEFTLEADKLSIRTKSGRPGRDIATECSSPLPNRVDGFKFSKVDGRGEMELIEDPANNRGSKATVRVKDPRPGAEEFQYRLEWDRGSFSGGSSSGSSSSSSDSGSARSGNVTSDTRDVSRWKTSDLRVEIERIFNEINRRYPTIGVVDDYIDKLRFERWTFSDVARDIDRKR
jgi:hypothetical protein